MDEFDFDSLTIIEIPVRFRGGDYVLREAYGEDVAQHKDALFACMKMKDGELAKVEGTAGMDLLLLSLCLFDASTMQRVPKDALAKWPHRVTRKLIEKVKEISELNADDSLESLEKQRGILTKQIEKLRAGKDAAKNAPSDTTDG